MENLNHDQALLSERLALLHKLDTFEDSRELPHIAIRHELKLLDTIALLLYTGRSGEYFEVAFGKREGLEVVLAKNGTITSEDVADAGELFSSLCNPETRDGKDLLPFVTRRCRANIVKHIRQLRAAIVDTGLYDDFCSRLAETWWACDPLSPSAIKSELPLGANSIAGKYAGEPLSVILRDLVDGIVRATVVSETLDVSQVMEVYKFAFPVAHSRFFKEWPRDGPVYEKVERFRRWAEELDRYIRDVNVWSTSLSRTPNGWEVQ